jgi:hypothetical protein
MSCLRPRKTLSSAIATALCCATLATCARDSSAPTEATPDENAAAYARDGAASQHGARAVHPRHVGSIVIAPESTDVQAGDTVRLRATLLNANGEVVEKPNLEWTSGDTTIATVEDGGLVSGRSAGTVTIVASRDGASDSARVRVRDLRQELGVSCEPQTIRLAQGSVGTISCLLTGPGMFVGSVRVRGEQLPTGVTIRPFDDSPIELYHDITVGIFLDVEVAPVSATGRYDARITATGDGISQTITVPLEIVARGPTVHMVYLLPSDVAYDPRVALGMDRAIRHLQIWYQNQLADGRTFSINFPAITVLHSSHPASYFATSSWTRATDEVFAALGGRFYDQSAVWNIYLPVVTDGQGGSASVALLGENDVLGISGEDTGGFTIARWVGGLGHEMGHAFGLPHPPGCEEGVVSEDCSSLMYLGYLDYPETFLTAAEKEQLNASPFFATDVAVTPRLFDANYLAASPRP